MLPTLSPLPDDATVQVRPGLIAAIDRYDPAKGSAFGTSWSNADQAADRRPLVAAPAS